MLIVYQQVYELEINYTVVLLEVVFGAFSSILEGYPL
jgi:hypothetical protein